MKAKKISQRSLAELTGIAQPHINRFLRGHCDAAVATLLKYFNALEISLNIPVATSATVGSKVWGVRVQKHGDQSPSISSKTFQSRNKGENCADQLDGRLVHVAIVPEKEAQRAGIPLYDGKWS